MFLRGNSLHHELWGRKVAYTYRHNSRQLRREGGSAEVERTSLGESMSAKWNLPEWRGQPKRDSGKLAISATSEAGGQPEHKPDIPPAEYGMVDESNEKHLMRTESARRRQNHGMVMFGAILLHQAASNTSVERLVTVVAKPLQSHTVLYMIQAYT